MRINRSSKGIYCSPRKPIEVNEFPLMYCPPSSWLARVREAIVACRWRAAEARWCMYVCVCVCAGCARRLASARLGSAILTTPADSPP